MVGGRCAISTDHRPRVLVLPGDGVRLRLPRESFLALVRAEVKRLVLLLQTHRQPRIHVHSADRIPDRFLARYAPFITAGTVSFIVGAMFFLLIIWPVIINFSLSYESAGLRSWFSLTAYVNFCLRLLCIFGLVFELPVVATILARLGLVTSHFLAQQRKFAVLASAIVAAFHADLITMCVIWIPLYFMYEVSIWMARLAGKRSPVGAAA